MTEDLARYIDHTFLKADGDKDAIEKLCREAREYGFAAVCVNPAEVKLAAKLLKGAKTKVCTVIGFPLGQTTFKAKLFEAIAAIEDGAEELDFVINQRLLKYDPAKCREELQLLSAAVKTEKKKILTKLIIECCNLTDEEKTLSCVMAKEAGFDFVKTSTGFGKGGATVQDVELMRRSVGKTMGVKAAGGIRDKETALKMIAAGATRLGTSAGVQIVTG